MKLSEIKIGDSYSWGGQWIAEGIEKANKAAGILEGTVICRSATFGDLRKINPRYLTPWEEQLAYERMAELGVQEMTRKTQMLREIIGEGTYIDGEIGSSWVRLCFTEAAAERVLEMCRAKPIPDNRRPSKARNSTSEIDEYARRCSLLGGRLRRALGAGYCGRYTGAILVQEGGGYQARITFQDDDIDKVLSRLGVKPKADCSSPLGDLLS